MILIWEVMRMLFSEIYNCYFLSVEKILKEARKGKLTGKKMTEIIQKTAFSDSFLIIEDALKSEEWPFLTKDWKTPIKHIPNQPLTSLQLRWMKSLLLDPKIHLFSPDITGLEDVQPLFEPEMFVYYDRYQDGDPYQEPTYIENFRTVLKALSQGKGVKVIYSGRTGREHIVKGTPKYLEYSAKDDKFRLKIIGVDNKYQDYIEINIARIASCSIVDVEIEENINVRKMKSVVLMLKDERNALTRAMLQFSYLEKETEQLADNYYRITLYYDRNDENELLIQILAFGPSIFVLEPWEFRKKIKERVERQMHFTNINNGPVLR